MKTFIVLSALVAVACAKSLPSVVYDDPCDQNAEDYDDCLLDKIKKVFPLIVNGDRNAKIPSLEPLLLPFLAVDGQAEGVNIKMVMKNTNITGHAQAEFHKFRFNPSTMTVDISYSIPYMRMLTEYYATGRLFVIPLESNSYFDGNFTGLDFNMHFTLKREDNNGVEVLQVDKMIFKGRLETAHIKLTSLNPEFQIPVTILENFFNNNDRLVLDTVNPIYRDYGADFYKSLFNNILQNIPADDLVPRT